MAKVLPSGSAITIANGIVFAVGNGNGKNNTINKTLVYMTQGCWVRAISQSNDQQYYQRGTIMAKFINNSGIAIANRRAAAQGLSLAALTAAIVKVSEAAKAALDRTSFGFSEGHRDPITNEEMATAISNLVGYSGGYMYGGGYASVIGGEVRFNHRTHWVRDYDSRDPATFVAGNLAILKTLEEGTTLRLGNSAQESSYEDWVLQEGVWGHTSSYSEQEARWAEQNLNRSVYLFSGIRAAVASELKVEADYGFHKLFDEAVCLLDN